MGRSPHEIDGDVRERLAVVVEPVPDQLVQSVPYPSGLLVAGVRLREANQNPHVGSVDGLGVEAVVVHLHGSLGCPLAQPEKLAVVDKKCWQTQTELFGELLCLGPRCGGCRVGPGLACDVDERHKSTPWYFTVTAVTDHTGNRMIWQCYHIFSIKSM